MSFDKLLSELQALGAEQDTMSKALPADEGKDDEKIQAAAVDGGDEGAAAAEAGADGDGDGDDDADGDEPMGKSLGTVTLPNGEQVEATDGTELVKALMARVETTEGQMQKALEGAIGLIKGQHTLIKSLTEQVSKLANAGRGRKAVVTVNEKTTAAGSLSKSEPGMTGQEFMLKANSAFSAGKISGKELTVIDVCLRQSQPVDPTLISKVLS